MTIEQMVKAILAAAVLGIVALMVRIVMLMAVAQ